MSRIIVIILVSLLGIFVSQQTYADTQDIDFLQETIKSAQQGNKLSQYNLGILYFRGKGVPKDNKQAFYWLEKSAQQGLAEAQRELGGIYEVGYGVPQDYKQAFHWYEKSARQQGSVMSQYHLGLMYFYGEIVPQDYKQAYAWLNMASAQGNERARDLRNAAAEKLTFEALAEAQSLSNEYFKKYGTKK